MSKARHIDYYPDEMIAGVAGQMSAVDFGVYWMVCTQIYSKGMPIDDDHKWLSRLFGDTHWRVVRASLDRLIASGKICQEGGKLMVKRCAGELQSAHKRIASASQNGSKGGRPRNEVNNLAKANGYADEKLTTNYQLPTTNQDSPKGESPHKPPSNRNDVADRDGDFEEFWRQYPSGRKQSKPKCREKYLRVVKSGDATPAELLAAVMRYAAAGYDNSKYVKGPLVWLNQGCWSDEDIPPPGDKTDGKRDYHSPRRHGPDLAEADRATFAAYTRVVGGEQRTG